ncbi:conserved hypothetical protein [Ricinus communis]|uniref:Uncharacterized protein n=1 Tax=Ricinus communis TaxID=3988 RepID=B9S5G0_RICCO|nr:conserved hypothetical protein [Ricinus communis]
MTVPRDRNHDDLVALDEPPTPSDRGSTKLLPWYSCHTYPHHSVVMSFLRPSLQFAQISFVWPLA